MPSDAQVQRAYDIVLAQYGDNDHVNGVDIGYAGTEKVIRVHIADAATPDAFAEGGPPSEIDGVKVLVVKASYGPEA